MTPPLPYILDDRETPRFRVHRSAMVEADVLAREREVIFDRTWLYVGHESEIPEPHDFRTRRVGGRPVILTRDSDGAVQVFVNSCPHRGMMVEARPEGHGRFLKCFYHGWSFNTSGDLVAMPDDDAYGPTFDRQNLCLARPPRVDSYRGFVFLCWSADVDDLPSYLGAAADYLDLVFDQSEEGMRVIGGSHQYSIRANWKLLAENSFDGYHTMTTHHRYVKMLRDDGVDLAKAYTGGSTPLAHDLGNGHAVIAGFDRSEGESAGLGRTYPSEEVRQQKLARRARLVELHGEEWTNRMLAGRNLVIFPNLVIVDLVMACTVRTFYPEAPDYMEVTGWNIQPPEETAGLHAMRMDNFLTFWGPAGLATPDDVEALERCQEGYRGYQAAAWNDISRGMVRDRPTGFDELQMRVWWRRWNELMTGEQLPPEVPVSVRSHDPGRTVGAE